MDLKLVIGSPYLISLALAASLIFFPFSVGHEGILIQYNISVWFLASLFVLLSVTYLDHKNSPVMLSKPVTVACLFPFMIVLHGLLFHHDLGEEMKSLFFILGGLCFLFMLMQFTLDRHKIMLILTFTSLLLAFVSVSHYLIVGERHDLAGAFHQINIAVSLLTTGLFASLFILFQTEKQGK